MGHSAVCVVPLVEKPQHAILTTANGTLFRLSPQDGFISIPIEIPSGVHREGYFDGLPG